MKKSSTRFLQAVIVLSGIVTLAVMIRFPLTEGRAVNLDLVSIYADPFIIYGYIAAIPFFIALYQTFKLLGHIGRNTVFLPSSVKALRVIKYCALTVSAMIVLAGLYIRMAHAPDDDPAGFLAMCIVTTFISVVVATAAAVFEKRVQRTIATQSENALTI